MFAVNAYHTRHACGLQGSCRTFSGTCHASASQLLKASRHPIVVSCKECFTSDGKLCIVMEYCSEGVATP